MKQFTLPLLRGIYLPEQKGLFESLELRGEAAKPMHKIYENICRLAPMGEDERRSIWLRFQSDYDGVQWGYMHISTYRDYHFMYIGTKYMHFTHCKWRIIPEENVDESDNNFYGYTKAYRHFAKKVLPIIDSICADPEAYNAYINRYVPHALRDGKIRRSTLNQIVPEFKLKLKDGAKTIEMLRHSISGKYTTFDTMTIRQYCRFFRAADEKFFHIEHNSDLSDIEYYKRHKGYSEMDELDMESEADFRKIAEDHYGELGLSRCNVCAHKRRDGKWKITLSLGYYHHLTNILETATACYEEGLAMEISCAKKMLDIIKERDYVGFTSSSFHQYLGDEEVGNEIELDTDLYDIEDPKRRRAAQRAIIKAAEWSPLEQVSCDKQ